MGKWNLVDKALAYDKYDAGPDFANLVPCHLKRGIKRVHWLVGYPKFGFQSLWLDCFFAKMQHYWRNAAGPS